MERNFGRGGGFRRSFGPRQMHKIKCSECGKEDEVPFKPRDGSPVYCKDCYFKQKGITPRSDASTSAPVKTEKPKKSEEAEESEDLDEGLEEETEDEEEAEEEAA